MLKKYIGPDEVNVKIFGDDFGNVSPGDKLVIPDDEMYANVKWSDSLWEDVVADASPKEIEAPKEESEQEIV